MSIYADIDKELTKRRRNIIDDNGYILDQILSEHSDDDIDTFWEMFDIHCEMISSGWSQKVTEEVDNEIVRRYDKKDRHR